MQNQQQQQQQVICQQCGRLFSDNYQLAVHSEIEHHQHQFHHQVEFALLRHFLGDAFFKVASNNNNNTGTIVNEPEPAATTSIVVVPKQQNKDEDLEMTTPLNLASPVKKRKMRTSNCAQKSPPVEPALNEETKLFKCDECGFACNSSESLSAHVAAHVYSERPYPCPDCDKRFREKRTLADHQRVHTGEKPFKCPLCPARFRQIPHCNRHMKTHRNFSYQPYPCDVCGKSFSRKFGLALHQHEHHAEFPFKCTACDKLFANLQSLGDHVQNNHHHKNSNKQQQQTPESTHHRSV